MKHPAFRPISDRPDDLEIEHREIERCHGFLKDKTRLFQCSAFEVHPRQIGRNYDSFIAIAVVFPQNVRVSEIWLKYICGQVMTIDGVSQWPITGVSMSYDENLLYLGPGPAEEDIGIAKRWLDRRGTQTLDAIRLTFPGLQPGRTLPILRSP